MQMHVEGDLHAYYNLVAMFHYQLEHFSQQDNECSSKENYSLQLKNERDV